MSENEMCVSKNYIENHMDFLAKKKNINNIVVDNMCTCCSIKKGVKRYIVTTEACLSSLLL